MLPAGIKQEAGVKNLLGNGVVIDPEALFSDFETLEKHNIDLKDRLLISDRANLVTELHK